MSSFFDGNIESKKESLYLPALTTIAVTMIYARLICDAGAFPLFVEGEQINIGLRYQNAVVLLLYANAS